MKKILCLLFFSIFTTLCFGQCIDNHIDLKKDRQRDWVKDYDNLVIIHRKQNENISILKKYFYFGEKSKTCISLDSLKLLQEDLEIVFKNTPKPDKLLIELKGAVNTVISRNLNKIEPQKIGQNKINSMESEEMVEKEVIDYEYDQSNERINDLEKGKGLWLWLWISIIAFIGTALMYLYDIRRLREQIAFRDKRYNKSQRETLDSERNDIQIWIDKYARLQKENDNLKKEYSDFKNSLSKSNVEIQDEKEIVIPQNVAEIATLEVIPKQFYLSIPTPSDDGFGIFRDMRQNQASPTGSFYRFELDRDETMAKFWFYDNPNTIQCAIVYPETYINPVCDYEECNSKAKSIITKIPGTAIKKGDSWKVLRKAKIQFE
jgi:hypothetical protein